MRKHLLSPFTLCGQYNVPKKTREQFVMLNCQIGHGTLIQHKHKLCTTSAVAEKRGSIKCTLCF